MKVVLFGRMFDMRIGKALAWSFGLLVLVLIGAFLVYFGRSLWAIRQGASSTWVERKLGSSVSRALANTNVSKEDLARLARTDRPLFGNATAPLTVVAFIDYDCPFTGRAAAAFREMLVKEQGRVNFVLRDFPLEEIHPTAFQASHAARCAFAQGKGWAYHDALFANPEQRERADFERFAAQSGLDLAKYRICMERQEFANAIREDLADGLRAGVEGTPTYFFNGIRIQGTPEDRAGEYFSYLVERFLQEPLKK